MSYKVYNNLDGENRTEVTVDGFDDLQNYYIKQVIRHTHASIPAEYVKIAEKGDSDPVGLVTPSDDSVLTFQDHLNLNHSGSLDAGAILASGWTVPTRVRCVITTPIYDTVSRLPFPTYNMSPLAINKSLASSSMRERVSTNRHTHDSYTNYRHYLWILPSGGVGKINPRHKPIIKSTEINPVMFSNVPLFIDSSNTDLLKAISDTDNVLDFKTLPYAADFSEERIWSLTEDSTCWLSGYKTIVDASHENIITFFNDFYNEFFQVLSMVNYEEKHRQYIYRNERAGGNLTNLEQNYLTNITKLMEAKIVSSLRKAGQDNDLYSSIMGNNHVIDMIDYYFIINNRKDRVRSNLYDSTIERKGDRFIIYPNGFKNYISNGRYFDDSELVIPKYFDEGYRQCMTFSGEYNTSERSLKRFRHGRYGLIYQVIDGFMSIPYTIINGSDTLRGSAQSNFVSGSSTPRNNNDVLDFGVSKVRGIRIGDE